MSDHEDRSGASTITLIPSDRADEAREDEPSYFLVIEGSSSTIVPLPSSGELVVGRANDAELRLTDASVSRKHTRLSVQSGEITAIDLGSHNGTRVNGQVIVDPRLLSSGDVLSIGDVVLVLHRGRRSAPRSLGRVDLSTLRERLFDAIDRSRSHLMSTAVMVLNSIGVALDPVRVEAALRDRLRRGDVYAFATPFQVVVVLPEVDEDDLREAANRLRERLSPLAPDLRVGGVCSPADGCDPDTLLSLARRAAESSAPGDACARPDLSRRKRIGEHEVLIADGAMIQLYELIERLAPSSLPVLIHGETGAGKEIAAAALHHGSPRRAQNLIAINCAALPESLAESELFGHKRGAFSGAVAAKVGLLESAQGGTVFLDEVGELSLAVQAKLLRALETRRITRLGDVRERPIDVRLVAATNRELDAEVSAGRFRRDLYFRLSAAVVRLPPLRRRQAEIPIFARAFLMAACASLGRGPLALSDRVMERLCAYTWPGNVRELKNDMDYFAATVEGAVVEPWHLPPKLGGASPDAPEAPEPGPGPSSKTRRFRPLEEELREIEKRRMIEALEATSGVQTRAADLIAMPRRTFFAKMKSYGLSPRGVAPPEDLH